MNDSTVSIGACACIPGSHGMRVKSTPGLAICKMPCDCGFVASAVTIPMTLGLHHASNLSSTGVQGVRKGVVSVFVIVVVIGVIMIAWIAVFSIVGVCILLIKGAKSIMRTLNP